MALLPIDLTTIASGTGGFVILGENAGDQSGFSVASAGDINGDGFADLIIGAPLAGGAAGGKLHAGDGYVVFGQAGGFGASVDLAAIASGTGGFVVRGKDTNALAGVSVASAGDINGDGFDDLIIGARYAGAAGAATAQAGESYVVFGKAGGFGASIDLAAIAAGNGGFALQGEKGGDQSGLSVAGAGDINGDGFADLIVGAGYAGVTGNNTVQAGESYVVFGKAGGFGATLSLSAVAAGNGGFVLRGRDDYDGSGRSVAAAGDINGDGFADLIVGAPGGAGAGNTQYGAGESYVVFGKASGFAASVDLASIAAGNGGFVLYGKDGHDYSGASVASAGDINGDGFADLIVGAPGGAAAGNLKPGAGESYVVFGKAGGFGASVNLAAIATGAGGFIIHGQDAGDQSGFSVAAAGDVNGDGIDDLIIGAPMGDAAGNLKANAGDSYVVFGKTGGFGAAIDLATIAAGNGGFVIHGQKAGDRSGLSVAAAGDVNGDGFADLIIGAPGGTAGSTKPGAGESYVLYGQDFTGTVTQAGSAGSDTLIGTAAADTMVGGTGDDILIGGGGADVLIGGAGDDTLRVSDLGFRRIDGGTGTDTLALDGTGLTLDLTATAHSRLQNIEIIDLTGTGANTLSLSTLAVLNLSGVSNTLKVTGNAGGTVTALDSGWIVTGEANGFVTYTSGQATLLVAKALTTGGGLNNTPAAANDAYTLNEDSTLTVAAAAGVLGNDAAAHGGALTAMLVSGPAHGSLTLNADGGLRYTPDANYNGTDSFIYKANEGASGSNPATVTLTIAPVNDPPVTVNDSYTIAEDTTLTVAAAGGVLANDTDVENDPLTAVLVSGPAHGSLTLKADGSLSYTPSANYNGTDSFTYKANDGTVDGTLATVTIGIVPVNDPPVAVNDSYTIAEDIVLLVTAAGGVLANDTDVEGDPLTAVLVSGPAHGSLSLNADGGLSYRPDANYNGTDSFTYKANDGTVDGTLATVTIGITPVNDPPTAVSDSYTIAEDTILTVAAANGVLANDSDVDGDALRAVLVSGPAHGSLSLNADGGLRYTPDANYNGVDGFTYKANDGTVDGNATTVTIAVTPVNDPPVSVSDSYTIAEDTTLTVAAASGVLANDSDVESDPLTAVLVSGPAHGVLTLNADGGLRYTPSANYNGADSFTYKANDGTVDGNVTTVAIGITPVNDAPVAVNDGYTLNEDTTLTVAAANGVLANDTDVENDPLTAALVSGPVHGTLTLNADGGLSYTPDANYNGADSFTYRTSDGALTSATATVALTIAAVNDAPVINGARAGQTTTDQTSLRPLAAMTIADPDSGATETVTLVLTDSASKATDANGTLSGAGLTKTGTGTYTLAAGAPAAVTAALEAVTFTPTAHQAAPGQTVTTGLYVAVSDGMLTAANGTTSIAATAAAVTPDDPPPAITVTAPALAYRNHAPLKLFAGTVITDPVREARDSLSITLRDGNGDPTDANGRLSGAGLTKTGTGTYTFAATTPAALTRELAGLSFRPAETRGGSMGGQVATHFTLAATRGGVTTVFNAFNTIVAGDNEDQDRHGRVSGGPMTVTGSVGGYTAALLGEGNHTVALGGGYNTVVAGDGDNTVIGAWGGFTAVTLGGGRQQVTLGGGSNTIVAGNGGTIVKGSPGGHTSVLLGHGDNVVEIGGTHDIVKLGNGANQVSGTEGMAFIVTGNGNDTIVTGGASNIINAGGGKNTIVTDAGSDTFVLPKAGQGFDSITGFSTLNGDVLDLRTALAATKWNGGSATLGTYLKVTSGGGDTTLSVTSTGRGVGTAIATLKGAGDLSLSELMSHHSLKF